MEKKISTKDIRRIVDQIYGIDLKAVSDTEAGKAGKYPQIIFERIEEALPTRNTEESFIMNLSKIEVLDLYMKAAGKKINGPSIRTAINGIFGINLDGISGLEDSGVSLFSKDQWISKNERDLFVVETGLTDVDVWVYPTEYFTEHTGLTGLPKELQEALSAIGFAYNKDVEAFYYSNPTGESVTDAFKKQTLGTIIKMIHTFYVDIK